MRAYVEGGERMVTAKLVWPDEDGNPLDIFRDRRFNPYIGGGRCG